MVVFSPLACFFLYARPFGLLYYMIIEKVRQKCNSEGESLKLLRERLGITQEDLASKLGVSERTISRAETGARVVKFSISQFKVLMALFDKAGISLYDLPDDPSLPSAD